MKRFLSSAIISTSLFSSFLMLGGTPVYSTYSSGSIDSTISLENVKQDFLNKYKLIDKKSYKYMSTISEESLINNPIEEIIDECSKNFDKNMGNGVSNSIYFAYQLKKAGIESRVLQTVNKNFCYSTVIYKYKENWYILDFLFNRFQIPILDYISNILFKYNNEISTFSTYDICSSKNGQDLGEYIPELKEFLFRNHCGIAINIPNTGKFYKFIRLHFITTEGIENVKKEINKLMTEQKFDELLIQDTIFNMPKIMV